ncbi:MAG: hypothetical protein IT320_09460 [Anaerolineae bacterium]|nr:hypothetical protein [Anaerolineae bacterium]
MSSRKPRRPTVKLLVLSACILFLSIMGFGGGIVMLGDPSGAGLGMETSMLAGTPFVDYLLPGLWLTVIYGVGGLVILYALWMRPNWSALAGVTRRTHEHWAWDVTLALGIVVMLWIIAQVVMIPMTAPIQAVVFVIGVIIVVIPLLPDMRHYYAV